MTWAYNKSLDYHYLKKCDFINEEKITLSVFNFYGTLVWGYNGEMLCYDSSKLIYSSPVADLVLNTYTSYGYEVCIFEITKNRSLIEPVKKCIQKFLDTHNLKYNVIITSYENFNKGSFILNKILYDFYSPVYKFGKKSFYCGDQIDEYDADPWFRLSNLDERVTKSMGLALKKSNEILGDFINPSYFYILNDVIITCGQEYSGYDMLYESIELDVIHLGMECKLDFFLNRRIYYILSEVFLDKYKDEKLIIGEDEHYVIVGSHPTFNERQNIISKCEKKDGTLTSSTAWFSKYPYQWSASYKTFLNSFDYPLNTGERWLRIN
jgi:hypothetical protein